LTQKDIDELIEKKIDKEANRYIQQWPADKISIENGRWGAFIRFNKKMLKLGRKENGEKYSPEELTNISLEDVKKMIEEQVPGAFAKKAAAKKTAAKKAPAKKAAGKKKAG
ncbi:MAG TPA: hypothetical protein VNS32_22275, partial [Flavisolibacter sp.]|nr:hypothetical protein [Flavisolibacter sp.]